MTLYEYKSYAEYLQTQIAGYELKKDHVFTSRKRIKAISKWIGPRRNGLCHGARTGQEMRWFRRYTKAKVYGTELGPSPGRYVKRWDFNAPRDEWIGYWDFVYSNSFDHAYAPAVTMKTWVDQVKPGGVLIIEHSRDHEKLSTKLDPFAATPEEIIELMSMAGLTDVRRQDFPVELWLRKWKYVCAIIGDKPL